MEISWGCQGLILEQAQASIRPWTELGMVAYACNPSTLGGLRWRNHLSPGVQDQLEQDGKTPYLQKIQKLAGHGGGCL